MVDVIECKLGSSKSTQPMHNISFQNQVKLQHSGYVIQQNNAHSTTDLPTGKSYFLQRHFVFDPEAVILVTLK